MSNFTSSTEMTFWETVIEQLMYAYLALTESSTRVKTMKGSKRVWDLHLRLLLYRNLQRKV